MRVSQPRRARRSCSAAACRSIANLQYYLPQFARRPSRVQGRLRQRLHAGRRGHAPRRRRQPDVPQRSRRRAAEHGEIFNSPLHQERAVMSTALYGQDSYSIGRLNVIGGIRWERIEGYLPAQTTPDSRYFPDGLVFQGVNDQRRRAELHGAEVVRRGAAESAVAQLGAARQPRPTICSATARPRSRRRGASTSTRSTPARRRTRTPTSTRPTSGTISTATWSSSRATRRGTACSYVGGEFGALQHDQQSRGGRRSIKIAAAAVPQRNHGQLDHELFPELPARASPTCARARRTRRGRSTRTSISGRRSSRRSR